MVKASQICQIGKIYTRILVLNYAPMCVLIMRCARFVITAALPITVCPQTFIFFCKELFFFYVLPSPTPLRFFSFVFYTLGQYFAKLAISTKSRQNREPVDRPFLLQTQNEDISGYFLNFSLHIESNFIVSCQLKFRSFRIEDKMCFFNRRKCK